MGGAYTCKWQPQGAYNGKFRVLQTNPYITNNYIEGLHVISNNNKHKTKVWSSILNQLFGSLDIGPDGMVHVLSV